MKQNLPLLALLALIMLPSCKKNIDGCIIYSNVKCKSNDNLSVAEMYNAMKGTWVLQRDYNTWSGRGWMKVNICRRIEFTSDTLYQQWIDGALYSAKYKIEIDTLHYKQAYMIFDSLPPIPISFCNGADLLTISDTESSGMYKRE